MSGSLHPSNHNAAVLKQVETGPVDSEKYKATNSVELIKSELKKTIFADFSNETAFIVGDAIRHLYLAQRSSTGILISIRLFSGLTLFQAACGDNVNPTNEDWVRRKYNTVKDFGMPTLQKARELENKGRDVNSLGPDYAAHGGGYPIMIKGVSAPVGAIIVSGLTQELDHALIVDALVCITPLL